MTASIAHALTGLFWLAALLLVAGLLRRSVLWRQGRPAAVDWPSLLAIPKRYFVDLHHVVARDPFIARAHVAVAGGAVAVLLLVALNYGLTLYWRWLDWGIVLFAALMFAGALLIRQRRQNPPARLSQGAWNRLPYSLLAFAAAMLLLMLLPAQPVAQLIAALALLLLVVGTAELVLGIGLGGPMKHAVAGLLHLAFHPRAERFSGERSTGLRPLDLDAGDYGVGKPADFAWNRLLSFDACVQCGKCEAACPAFAAGQPLNPKKLIQDMVVGMAGGSDAQFAGSPYPGKPLGQHHGAPDQPIVGQLIDADTLWSCTTCRACVQECPMLIEHVDAVVDLRRHVTLTRGEVPNKGGEALDNLQQTDTVGGFPVAVRYNWAIDLNVPVLQAGQQVDYLLLAGEGAFDMRYQRALRALVLILKHAGLSFAVLGSEERDCGDLARRLGDEATFQRLAKENIAQWKTLQFRHIITPDPHVFHCVKNEYPAFGGEFQVLHHSQLIAELLQQQRLRLKEVLPDASLTFHDPCYLGRYNGETTAPRAVLKGIGIKVVEMGRSGMTSRCCGWGGGASFTDIPGERRIPDMRMQDVRESGSSQVAVACPNCTAMLEGVVGDRPEVIELAELVAARLAD
ncbi:(Fe-S)-binding protein [Leeia aquatica]|uniref:(Fe-S)-binding protein n=1 Tax=Leeia aquatica TaxID=2725557 RepID=A0A847S501_9NEIS|nr:(Fe-S)-binding protein [Leeia aquatica]NLR73855.1 (Fe-S)-binding protein [Leeia aquatica]